MKIISFEEFEYRMDKKFKFVILDGEKWYIGVHFKAKPSMPGVPLKMAYSSYVDFESKK